MFSVKQIVEDIKSDKNNLGKALSKCLEKCEQENPKLNAFLNIFHDDTGQQANEIKTRLEKGETLPLAGVPIAIKDNICTKGLPTTCASKILKGYKPPYDAFVIKKLKKAGAIIIGKTNMDEFAMGSSSEHSAFGTTKNPHDTARTPGGSSSGSAAAVAGGLVPAALGSDTGGSIRQPAALTGCVGLKPTYGRVSRSGLVAFASSLDQIGPLTSNVYDAALILNAISGHDIDDSTSLNVKDENFTDGIDQDIKGLKIGLPKEYFIEGLDSEVKDNVSAAAKALQKEGAELIDISLPHTEYAVPTYYILAPAEASANLARYDGIRYGLTESNAADLESLYKETRTKGFGPEVTLRILIGTYVLSSGYYDAYYRKGQKVRTLIRRDFDDAFKKVDVILTPTTPETAFKFGERLSDPIKMYLSDIFTLSANLAGIPGISVPCGFDQNSLPIGMQLMGPAMDEKKLLRAAYNYEKIRGF